MSDGLFETHIGLVPIAFKDATPLISAFLCVSSIQGEEHGHPDGGHVNADEHRLDP